MRVAFVQQSLGGVLEHTMVDVPHDGARWSSSPAPTVRLLDAAGGELKSSTAATLGVSTTLSAAAAAEATGLTLLTTSGFERFGEYLLGPNAGGEWQWVTVVGVSTGGVKLAEKIEFAFSSGNAIKSHSMTYTVPASTVGSIARDCHAEWSYYVDGVKRQEHTLFHVSLYAPRLSLTAARFVEAFPRARRMKASSQDLDLLIRRTWQQHVLPDISRLYRPGAVVSGEMCERALVARVKQLLLEDAKERESADRAGEEYTAEIDLLREGLLDLDEDGAKSDSEVVRSLSTPRIRRT